MSPDQSARIQHLLDRLRQGDESAQSDLMECAYAPLQRLARRIFHDDFSRLRTLHRTDSILHEALLRLLQASPQAARWPTPLDFFRYSAGVIRHILLDLIRYHDRRGPDAARGGQGPSDDSTRPPGREPADTSGDPTVLAIWTEFHQRVGQLPEEERAVVELHLYDDLSQAETARLLGVHEKVVSRRWLSARLKLADWIPDWERLLGR